MVNTMIEIHDNRKISEIEEHFSFVYPFLKLVFLNKRTGKKLSNDTNYIAGKTTIGMYRKTPVNMANTITRQNTVADLEAIILEQYDLFVQVLRKSGKAWLETSVTGEWTLGKQNNEGEQLSNAAE
jgi:hypothetical protein